LTLSRCGDKEG